MNFLLGLIAWNTHKSKKYTKKLYKIEEQKQHEELAKKLRAHSQKEHVKENHEKAMKLLKMCLIIILLTVGMIVFPPVILPLNLFLLVVMVVKKMKGRK